MLTALVWCTAMAATCCSIRTAGRGRMITALQHRCPHQAAGRIIRPTRTIARAATTSVVMMMKHHRSVGAPSVVERQPDLTTRQPCCSRRSWRRNPRVCAPQRLINTRADQKTCYKEEAEEEEGAFGERISTVRSSRRKSSVSWGKATKLFSTALAVLAPSATEGELSYRAERGQGVGYHGDDICGLQVNYLTANGHEDDEGERWARCHRLASELEVPLLVDDGEETHGDGAVRFTMLYDDRGRLALGQPGSGFSPLVVDFCAGRTGYRTKQQQGAEQVVKAASLPKRKKVTPKAQRKRGADVGDVMDVGGEGQDEETPLLWDLTAGLGTDAFILASAGWEVQMFERSPVVAALVQDALARARKSDDDAVRSAASRMSLRVADSTTTTSTEIETAVESDTDMTGDDGDQTTEGEFVSHPNQRRPAVVYLDPMFPHRKKSALVKKGMQMLQALLEMEEKEQREGSDSDPGDGASENDRLGGDESDKGRRDEDRRLFETAMRFATRKVVVKRPVHGAAIVEHVNPSHSLVSKNGRFDVYAVP